VGPEHAGPTTVGEEALPTTEQPLMPMTSSMRSILLCGRCSLLFTCGCGYNQARRRQGQRQGRRLSLGVPVSFRRAHDRRADFLDRSFDRGTEFNLSQAVVKQIEATTPYKVVPRERADTILEGMSSTSPSHAQHRPQRRHPAGAALGLTIDFTWKDLRTGRVLVERRGFEQTRRITRR
jgi:hypothetical protein